jgi:uncharacterized protein YunC (DUF1805 family)
MRNIPEGDKTMVHEKVYLAGKQAEGYVIPLGDFNIVTVVTDSGMVGCGAFDLAALESLGYPAARVKGYGGKLIATIDDLLAGKVKDANKAAVLRGIKIGMSGKEALELL